jgi:predicted nucleotidyltransferase
MSHAIDRVISRMARSIVRRCSPEKVILFGSHATGRAGPDSDVDLLVVMRSVRSKARQVRELRAALSHFPLPKDIIVTTAAEFEWRKDVPGTIERPAARDGRVLYEKR